MKILTFDIEEWFHILDNESTENSQNWSDFEVRIHQNMDRIFKILDDHKVSATFFCLGWIAKNYPQIVKEIHSMGYEVATHSHMHKLAYKMTQKEYEEDLKYSIYQLEDITGEKVVSYRAPGFSVKKDNLWVFESLHKFGIENDCSIFPANRSHGGIPGFEEDKPCKISYDGIILKEFPINTATILGKRIIFSGGGYFRLFPYWLIKKESQKQNYVMTYFHPRDFDQEQPMIDDLGLFRKFKSYYGLSKCESKLRNWLQDFDFIDLKTAQERIDWKNSKTVFVH
ncbi:MAG: polysaccharide deacetylase family protein [Bacteroidota bacterium]